MIVIAAYSEVSVDNLEDQIASLASVAVVSDWALKKRYSSVILVPIAHVAAFLGDQ